jgi:hypothetical protein
MPEVVSKDRISEQGIEDEDPSNNTVGISTVAESELRPQYAVEEKEEPLENVGHREDISARVNGCKECEMVRNADPEPEECKDAGDYLTRGAKGLDSERDRGKGKKIEKDLEWPDSLIVLLKNGEELLGSERQVHFILLG